MKYIPAAFCTAMCKVKHFFSNKIRFITFVAKKRRNPYYKEETETAKSKDYTFFIQHRIADEW